MCTHFFCLVNPPQFREDIHIHTYTYAIPSDADRPEARPPPYGPVLVLPAADPETRLRVQEFYLEGDPKQYGKWGRETGKDGGDAYSAHFSRNSQGPVCARGARPQSSVRRRAEVFRAGRMPTASKSPAWTNRAQPSSTNRQGSRQGGAWSHQARAPHGRELPAPLVSGAPPEPSLAAGTLKGDTRATAGSQAGGTQWVQQGTQGLSEEEPTLLKGSLGLTPAPQTTPIPNILMTGEGTSQPSECPYCALGLRRGARGNRDPTPERPTEEKHELKTWQ